MGIRSATVFNLGGKIFAHTSSEQTAGLLPNLPDAGKLRQIVQNLPYSKIEGDIETGLIIESVVSIPVRNITTDPPYLYVSYAVPDALARPAEDVQTAFREYQQLSFGRVALKAYGITLSLALLLALLAAMSVAIYMTRRFVAPLLILAGRHPGGRTRGFSSPAGVARA